MVMLYSRPGTSDRNVTFRSLSVAAFSAGGMAGSRGDSTNLCSTVQYGTEQYSMVQTVQYNTNLYVSKVDFCSGVGV